MRGHKQTTLASMPSVYLFIFRVLITLIMVPLINVPGSLKCGERRIKESSLKIWKSNRPKIVCLRNDNDEGKKWPF